MHEFLSGGTMQEYCLALLLCLNLVFRGPRTGSISCLLSLLLIHSFDDVMNMASWCIGWPLLLFLSFLYLALFLGVRLLGVCRFFFFCVV